MVVDSAAQADDGPNPTLAWRLLIAELQALFAADGRTFVEIARELMVDEATVGRWIGGKKKSLRPMDVEALLKVFGYPPDHPTTRSLVQLVHAAKRRGFIQRHSWFDSYRFDQFVRLEQGSTAVDNYESSLIPGLLQIPTYADAVIRASVPGVDENGVAERLKVRMDRQFILRRTRNPVVLRAWIDEAALRRRPSDGSMRGQLEHLLRVAQEWENVTIRVIPLEDGPNEVSASGPFVLLWFDGASKGFRDLGPVGYQETITGAVYAEAAEETDQIRSVLGHLDRRALDPDASSDMIRAIIGSQ